MWTLEAKIRVQQRLVDPLVPSLSMSGGVFMNPTRGARPGWVTSYGFACPGYSSCGSCPRWRKPASCLCWRRTASLFQPLKSRAPSLLRSHWVSCLQQLTSAAPVLRLLSSRFLFQLNSGPSTRSVPSPALCGVSGSRPPFSFV